MSARLALHYWLSGGLFTFALDALSEGRALVACVDVCVSAWMILVARVAHPSKEGPE